MRDRIARLVLGAQSGSVIAKEPFEGGVGQDRRPGVARRDGLSSAELGSVRPPSPFRTVDTNNDGRITMGEWPWSRRTFIQQDADSNGWITRQEYRGGGGEQ